MNTATLNLVTEIVTTRYGFITDQDMPILLSDDTIRNGDVLLRFDAGRKVVKLKDVIEEITAIERQGNYLRDVAFTAKQCDIYRAHL